MRAVISFSFALRDLNDAGGCLLSRAVHGVPTRVLRLLALAFSALIALPAAAQYPNRPVTFVVPFTLGTGIDIIARTLGQKLSERWGQAVVIDNRPGASGNIGNEMVAKAPGDGYTLLVSATSMVTNAVINKNAPYDPVKSYAPVVFIARGTLALLSSNATPVRSVADLVALAKQKPGELNYGSPGNGTTHHLTMELFKRDTGISVTHIPYKGTTGVINDVIGSRLNAIFMPIHTVLPYVQQGSVRLLAVLAAERSPVFPDTPTMKEAGFPNVHVENWYGMLAPAATPQELVTRLNTEINAQIATAAVKDVLTKQGLNTVGGPPSRLADLIRSERERWPAIVAAAGIRAD